MANTIGLVGVVAAAALAAVSADKWQAMTQWAGPPWTSDPFRWAVVALLATIGVSFVRARPIFVVIHAGIFALAALALNYLLGHRGSRGLESVFGAGGPVTGLAVASAAFGFLVYTHPRAGAPNLRGILGLLIVIAAAELVIGARQQPPWFDWPGYAARLGPAAERMASECGKWGQEVQWAAVLVITAIGVSLSRTRPVHLLIAVLLAGLAYCCVKGGYSALKTFPDLSTGGKLIQIEHESYTNVELWRWVVAAELTCLAAVLLHMSLGMGALNVAFAVAWMGVGLSLYHSVGTMSAMRIAGSATALGMDPMVDMGLPVGALQAAPSRGSGAAPVHKPGGAAPGTGTAARSGAANNEQLEKFIRRVARPGLINESTLTVWMVLTAVLAGIICVAGLRMLLDRAEHRALLLALLWLAVLIGAYALWRVWPRDPAQSWEEWLAAFKFSRFHGDLIWLIFGGTMGIAGLRALRRDAQASTWVHAAIAAIFLGTSASLVAAAIMISFGGFPRLPIWVYCVVAAGQSSLAWALLFHVDPPMSRSVDMRRLTGP